MKPDKTDMKILNILDLEGRASYSSIAKRLNLSKDKVNYRISLLEKEGFIKGYYTVIDTLSLGYDAIKFYIRLVDSDSKVIEEIKEFCTRLNTKYVLHFHGAWDLGLMIVGKDNTEIMKAWTSIRQRFGSRIKETDIAVSMSATFFRSKYLFGEYDFRQLKMGGKNYVIDELNKNILKIIASDARISATDLAEKTRSCPETVRRRLKELEKGPILGYRANIDDVKFGLQYYNAVLYFREHEEKDQKELFSYLAADKDVSKYMESIGSYDLEISFIVASADHLLKKINLLKTRFSFIREIQTAYTDFLKIEFF